MIRQAMILLAAAVACAAPAAAGPAEDATAAVTTWLDKFNAGDIAAFNAGHAPGAVIVDEFSPFLWTGPNASQRWLDDYGKDAAAGGISGGRLDYAAPIRATASGNTVYVVLPTIYRMQQGGKAKSAAGTMTFVMTRAGNEWKIAAWTYSAPPPR
ncbi:MAG TPA: nuclear transport factor 2 family protein [Sphingomicrobium sp.]|jgi:ketosteroid isomerase-like protein|nr:nuclear transport factor 2 family protein [Sphingomicrobium sp.]